MILRWIFLLAIFFVQPKVEAFSWLNVLNKTITGTHWTLLMVPALGIAGNQVAGSEALKRYPDASPELTEFVKNKLKEYNCSSDLINNLRIKIGDRFQAGYILNDKSIITIPKNLQSMGAWSPQQRMAVGIQARHEAAHLENKDMLRMIAVSLLSPFLAHGFVKGITNLFLKPSGSSVVRSLLRTPVAFLTMALMAPPLVIFKKYREYSADKKAAASIHDSEALRNMAQLHLTVYENYERMHKLNPQDRGTWKRFIYDELHTPGFMHPNYLLRSQLFEKAAIEIEKKLSQAA